jgi:PhnB protein
MGAHLNPYIGFGDHAREAMEFYREVFGGTLNLMTFGDMGTEGPDADKIMHAQLETPDGFYLMGADATPGEDTSSGSNISISLSGDQGDDLRRWWDRLADGGAVMVPLEKQMWGDEFGMCADRFGVTWMVNIAQPRD